MLLLPASTTGSTKSRAGLSCADIHSVLVSSISASFSSEELRHKMELVTPGGQSP